MRAIFKSKLKWKICEAILINKTSLNLKYLQEIENIYKLYNVFES